MNGYGYTKVAKAITMLSPSESAQPTCGSDEIDAVTKALKVAFKFDNDTPCYLTPDAWFARNEYQSLSKCNADW